MHGSSLPLPEPEDPAKFTQNRADVIYQELIPQFTVAFVFFLLTVMARSFIHEKQQGTLRRLRLAPIRPTSILVGKTIPFFVISVLQTVLLFTAGKLLFDMSLGARPWALVPVVFCTSLAATGLGLLVATIVRTDSQVSWVGNAIVLTTAGISGCFMPRDWMPPLMQEISKVTPHAWALEGFKQLLSFDNPNLSIVFFNCGVLLGFALLFFVAGCMRVAYVE
jgi:ABC-2 type transport system permease protein